MVGLTLTVSSTQSAEVRVLVLGQVGLRWTAGLRWMV